MRSDYKSARADNEVSHQGYDYHEIEELIKKLFNI